MMITQVLPRQERHVAGLGCWRHQYCAMPSPLEHAQMHRNTSSGMATTRQRLPTRSCPMICSLVASPSFPNFNSYKPRFRYHIPLFDFASLLFLMESLAGLLLCCCCFSVFVFLVVGRTLLE